MLRALAAVIALSLMLPVVALGEAVDGEGCRTIAMSKRSIGDAWPGTWAYRIHGQQARRFAEVLNAVTGAMTEGGEFVIYRLPGNQRDLVVWFRDGCQQQLWWLGSKELDSIIKQAKGMVA